MASLPPEVAAAMDITLRGQEYTSWAPRGGASRSGVFDHTSKQAEER
eukprot:CAMPEP_0168462994 /NCGR_PEP_ID=MMETSP0228-20121227/54822_1 /TAXON_ID=133427 /ORGANISM="Protoceratium reticulatum, Strain CCCM 535 (=CCMP 1889)" /LENGTH=46 /DNA_ID= /DNA_START= /DNA_END= /DNA_ORIENTATION=